MRHQTSSHPRCGVSAGVVAGYVCMEYQLYTLQIIQRRTHTQHTDTQPIMCDYVHCVLYTRLGLGNHSQCQMKYVTAYCHLK